MIEARLFVDNFEDIRSKLSDMNAVCRGDYEITDHIYRSKNEKVSLTDEFVRSRIIPKNIWPGKSFLIACKQTKQRNIGKQSSIPFKKEFDSEAEAREYLSSHLSDEYEYDFSYHRIGWQYDLLNGDQVDLEVLNEKYLTIECKSETDDGIKNLLGCLALDANEAINGPAVVAFRKIITEY